MKVGVTGGIGAGKTTFCKVWEELGAYVIYADDLAKELMVTDIELILKVKFTFGENAYFEDGSLNRAFLAEEAFEKHRVEELNAIVHPILWRRIDQISNEKEKEGVEIFVKEAAILLKNGRPEELDSVILLISDKEDQIIRSIERDNTDPKKIESRIDKQPDFNTLTHLADYVIENNGTVEELKEKAKDLFYLIK